ncbi:MAG: hypothetical protein HUU06_06050, partial [Planctomycetaceae bacterium]|nr:hypothetical protein [Planctomycetaceae bacterium]
MPGTCSPGNPVTPAAARAKKGCMVETRSVRPADPDALFARFREHGDPAALAALFDATADGLHRLA